ncbi:MAG: inositol monophosphatase family protein [Gammaproteobacteria bacterium]|nr:inositol monophosphatase family protein [Gammaproteobacteria bacterium]
MSDPRAEISGDERRALLGLTLDLVDTCAQSIRESVAAGFEVSRKPDGSLVTTADVAAERAFRERLTALRPDAGILGEELGETNPAAPYRWIIDPIDGTAEFARHVPIYGCIVGLWYRGEPLVGVLDHPALGMRAHAVHGGGAFAGDVPLSIAAHAGIATGVRLGLPSRVSFVKDVDSGAVHHALAEAYPNYRAYHTCYAHTLVAAGALDAAMEWDTPIWDLAATRVIVEEAGGRYLTLRSRERPGVGMVHSAVFGRPDVVDAIADLVAKYA